MAKKRIKNIRVEFRKTINILPSKFARVPGMGMSSNYDFHFSHAHSLAR